MENPDLVLQETGSRPTYSRLNYVPSGDTLRRAAVSSLTQLSFFFSTEVLGSIAPGTILFMQFNLRVVFLSLSFSHHPSMWAFNPSVFIWYSILHFYEIKFHIFKCKIHFYEEKCIY